MVLKNWDFKLTQKESREFYASEPALFFTASIKDIYTEFTENNINGRGEENNRFLHCTRGRVQNWLQLTTKLFFSCLFQKLKDINAPGA